jgi:hypothetical protein
MSLAAWSPRHFAVTSPPTIPAATYIIRAWGTESFSRRAARAGDETKPNKGGSRRCGTRASSSPDTPPAGSVLFSSSFRRSNRSTLRISSPSAEQPNHTKSGQPRDDPAQNPYDLPKIHRTPKQRILSCLTSDASPSRTLQYPGRAWVKVKPPQFRFPNFGEL